MVMRLQHPSDREHPLILRELSENCSIQCAICHLYFNGPTYCCWDCHIFLHKSCAELPLKTEHPAHPEHPTLSLETTGACIPEVFFYLCDGCSFTLDVSPVALYQLKEEEEEKEIIQHFAHDHPLTPFKLDMTVDVGCRACRRPVSGPIYACHACSFYLHEWCAQLPREISQHPFHPQHHLALFPKADKSYDVCLSYPDMFKYDLDFYLYKCNECQFNIDVRCASLEPSENQQEDRGVIKHHSHQHQLAPFSMKMENPNIRCEACRQNISGEVYGCLDCKFFLHKSCLQAQRKSGRKTAKHQPHEHDLDYFDIKAFSRFCNYCGEKCWADSYGCFACSFFVHYNCIRTLPLSIKHDCHFHPLVLQEKFVPFDDE